MNYEAVGYINQMGEAVLNSNMNADRIHFLEFNCGFTILYVKVK